MLKDQKWIQVFTSTAALSYFTAGALALITINYQFLEVEDSAGTSVPVGTVGFLAASTTDNDFGIAADLNGVTISQGSTFGVDNVILATFQATDQGGGIIGFGGAAVFDPSTVSNLTAGDQLQLYWIPENQTIDSIFTGGQIGTFRSDLIVSGSTTGYILPSDGQTINLNANSESVGGDVPDEELRAIPEPSSVALLSFGLAFFLRRRRS